MNGKFRISYNFDLDYSDDAPYQARCLIGTGDAAQMLDAWASSFAEARQNLITILQSIPSEEEIDL